MTGRGTRIGLRGKMTTLACSQDELAAKLVGWSEVALDGEV